MCMIDCFSNCNFYAQKPVEYLTSYYGEVQIREERTATGWAMMDQSMSDHDKSNNNELAEHHPGNHLFGPCVPHHRISCIQAIIQDGAYVLVQTHIQHSRKQFPTHEN